MDDAFWYGTTMSLKGRHSREIAAWQDAYDEAENALREWRSAALSAEERADRLGDLNDELIALVEKMGKRLDFLEGIALKALEMDENLKKLAPRYKEARVGKRLEEIKSRVEHGQHVRYRTLFRLLLDYVPGLKEDLLGDGKGIMEESLRAYEASLLKQGITPEMLSELKATGYGFDIVSEKFGTPSPESLTDDQKATITPPRKFVSKETIQLRGKVDDLRAKYNNLVEKHNEVVDDRFHWAYRSVLNKAEAEGHKAVLELVRTSSREIDLDTPDPNIPAPEGHCDSPVTAAFRRAYARHVLEEKASREELEQFSRETSFEFPFPVQAYMDWIAAQSQEDIPSEGQEGPPEPR